MPMRKPRKLPAKRNPIARELASRLYAARIVPPRKGKGAQPKRPARRVEED